MRGALSTAIHDPPPQRLEIQAAAPPMRSATPNVHINRVPVPPEVIIRSC